MDVESNFKFILGLLKKLVVWLAINLIAALVIVLVLSVLTSMRLTSVNYGVALFGIGVLYLLMGYGSFNGAVEQNTSIGLMMARSISVGDYDERRDSLLQNNNDARFMTFKLFICGTLTVIIAYFLCNW